MEPPPARAGPAAKRGRDTKAELASKSERAAKAELAAKGEPAGDAERAAKLEPGSGAAPAAMGEPIRAAGRSSSASAPAARFPKLRRAPPGGEIDLPPTPAKRPRAPSPIVIDDDE